MNWELTGQYRPRAYLTSEEHRGNGRAAEGRKRGCGPAARRMSGAFAGGRIHLR